MIKCPARRVDRSPAPFDLSDHPWIRTLVRVFILLMIGVVLLVFEGLALHLTPWWQVIVNEIVWFVYPTPGQKDTTVLLFREENLSEMGASIPVPYEIHASVLDRLAHYRPRAVLVDFAFTEKSPLQREAPPQQDKAQSDLRDVICRLAHTRTDPETTRSKTTQVYLALTTLRPLEGLLTCNEKPDPIPVSVARDLEYGVSGVLSYERHGVAYKRDSLETPAFAMLDPPIPEKSKEPMEVIWDPKPAPLNRKWLCLGPRASPLTILLQAIRLDPLLATRQQCPHTRTISVHHLLHSDVEDPDPDVTEALHGKTVFYGAGFLMAGDTVRSPVSGDVAAVYLHAMAYDNLFTFRSEYKLKTPIAFDAVLLLLVVAALPFADKPFKRLPRFHASVRWGALGLAALGAVLWWPSVMSVPPSWSMKIRSALFLLLPLFLVGAFAVLGPARATPEDPQRARNVLRQYILTAIAAVAAVVVILVATGAGFGVLAALLCYFLYRLFVAEDTLFVVTVLLLVAASALGFWFGRLGPRNIIVYVAFFEVARHLLRHNSFFHDSKETKHVRMARRSA